MEPLVKSDIFFFISSIGFFLITVLLCVVLVYAILIAHKFLAISKIAKEKAEEIGEAVTEVKDSIVNGSVVHWIQYLFGSRAKKETSKTKRSRSQDNNN